MYSHMFWADWGQSPKLERSGMDGDETTRSDFVSDGDIFWPNSLTIDHEAGRIYWTDMKLTSIQSVRLDGSDRRPFYVSSGTGAALPSSSLHPTSIALVGDLIYWTNWQTKVVYAANKHGDAESKEGGDASIYRVVATSIRVPTVIRAYGSQSQPQCEHHFVIIMCNCTSLCSVVRSKVLQFMSPSLLYMQTILMPGSSSLPCLTFLSLEACLHYIFSRTKHFYSL